MADMQQINTKRDAFHKRIRERYPDREFADDEAIYSQASDDYDQYDQDIADRDSQISTLKAQQKAISDMYASDPRSASMLMSMKDGESPAVGLMRRFGPEIRDILDDPERQEEIAEAEAEYIERVSKEQELEKLYKENLAQSIEAMRAFQEERSLSDDQIDDLMEKVIAVGNDMIVGKFTKETLQLFSNAMNFDNAVSTAKAQGEIEGRNANIKERLRRSNNPGDGTPQLGGANNPPDTQRERPKTMFDMARLAK